MKSFAIIDEIIFWIKPDQIFDMYQSIDKVPYYVIECVCMYIINSFFNIVLLFFMNWPPPSSTPIKVCRACYKLAVPKSLL